MNETRKGVWDSDSATKLIWIQVIALCSFRILLVLRLWMQPNFSIADARGVLQSARYKTFTKLESYGTQNLSETYVKLILEHDSPFICQDKKCEPNNVILIYIR
jgi:hypothetical protein